MNRFRGTKGIWYYQDNMVKSRDSLYTHYICDFSDCDNDDEESNAQLIAASPMLLDALIDLVKFCEDNDVDCELGFAEEAINKALNG